MAGGSAYGELVIKFTSDIADILSNTEKMQKGLESWSRNVTSTINGIKKTISSITEAFVVWETIKHTVVDSVEAFAEVEAAQIRLQAVLEATGNKAQTSVERVSEFAEQLSRVTTFSDDEIINSAANLAKYTQVTGDTFERTLRDAANLAAVTGGPLSESVNTLGRALENAFAASRLRRVGLLTDAEVELQKALHEAGLESERIEALLGAIEARSAGAATTVGGHGLASAFTELRNATQNAEEDFGQLITEVFGLEEKVRSLTATVHTLRDLLKEPISVKVTFELSSIFGGAVADTLTPLGTLKTFITSITSAVGGAAVTSFGKGQYSVAQFISSLDDVPPVANEAAEAVGKIGDAAGGVRSLADALAEGVQPAKDLADALNEIHEADVKADAAGVKAAADGVKALEDHQKKTQSVAQAVQGLTTAWNNSERAQKIFGEEATRLGIKVEDLFKRIANIQAAPQAAQAFSQLLKGIEDAHRAVLSSIESEATKRQADTQSQLKDLNFLRDAKIIGEEEFLRRRDALNVESAQREYDVSLAKQQDLIKKISDLQAAAARAPDADKRAATLSQVAAAQDELKKAVADTYVKQVQLGDATKQWGNDAVIYSNKVRDELSKMAESFNDSVAALNQMLDSQARVTAQIGLTREQVAGLNAEYDATSRIQGILLDLERKYVEAVGEGHTLETAVKPEQARALKEYIEQISRIAPEFVKANKAAAEFNEAATAALNNQVTAWEGVLNEAEQVWNGILDGGKNVLGQLADYIKTTLRKALFDLVAKQWVIPIIAQISGGAVAGTLNDKLNTSLAQNPLARLFGYAPAEVNIKNLADASARATAALVGFAAQLSATNTAAQSGGEQAAAAALTAASRDAQSTFTRLSSDTSQLALSTRSIVADQASATTASIGELTSAVGGFTSALSTQVASIPTAITAATTSVSSTVADSVTRAATSAFSGLGQDLTERVDVVISRSEYDRIAKEIAAGADYGVDVTVKDEAAFEDLITRLSSGANFDVAIDLTGFQTAKAQLDALVADRIVRIDAEVNESTNNLLGSIGGTEGLDDLSRSASVAAGAVQTFALRLPGALSDAVNRVVPSEEIASAFSSAAGDAQDVFSRLAGDASDLASSTRTLVAEATTSTATSVNELAAAVSSAAGTLSSQLGEVSSTVGAAATSATNAIQTAARSSEEVFGRVATNAQNVMNTLAADARSVSAALLSGAERAFAASGSNGLSGTVADSTSHLLSGIATSSLSVSENIAADISESTNNILNSTTSFFDSTTNTMTTGFKDLTNSTTDTFRGLTGATVSLFGGLSNTVVSLFSGIAQSLGGIAPGVVGGVSNALGSVSKLFGNLGGNSLLGGIGDVIFGAGSAGAAALGAGFSAGLSTLGIAFDAGSAAVGGFSAVLGAAGAVIAPLIPVFALALPLISGLFDRAHGPKSGGFAETGNFTALAPGERYFTPSDADAQAAEVVKGISTSITDAVTALGGNIKDLGVGFGYDIDKQGTAQSRVSAGVSIGGQTIFNQHDVEVGRSDQELQAGIETEAARAVLAAVQNSNLPTYLANILNTVVASAASKDQATAIIQTAEAAKTLVETLSKALSPEQVTRFNESLNAIDFSQATNPIKAVVEAGFNELAPAFTPILEAFNGTDEELTKFAATLVGIATASAHFSEEFKNNIVKALDGATQATADKVAAFVAIFAQFGSSIEGLGPKLEALDPTSMIAFVDALGGAQQAVDKVGYIFQNFTTSSQKLAANAALLTTDFNNLGITAIPQTHQQFLDLLDSFDLTTESGREMYNSVAELAPLFIEVAGTADQAAQALEDQANAGQDYYTQHFLTPQEQTQQRQIVDETALYNATKSGTLLNQVLTDFGLSVIPSTVEGVRNLVNATRDKYGADSEEYKALLAIIPVIGDLIDSVDGFAKAADAAITSVGNLIKAGDDAATKLLKSISDLANASTGDFGDKLSLQIGLISDALSDAGALQFPVPGGGTTFRAPGGADVQTQAYITELGSSYAALVDELARFTTLSAQYDAARAEQLVGLQDWYNEQKAIFAGNTDALAALDQVFQQKWDAIVNGTTDAGNGVSDALDNIVKQIRDFVASLETSDLSTLTPTQKLSAAQDAFNKELAAAQAGDQSALQDITKYANDYLTQARAVYASSTAYTDIFNSVIDALNALADGAESSTNAINDAANNAANTATNANTTLTNGVTNATNSLAAPIDNLTQAATTSVSAINDVSEQTAAVAQASADAVTAASTASTDSLTALTAAFDAVPPAVATTSTSLDSLTVSLNNVAQASANLYASVNGTVATISATEAVVTAESSAAASSLATVNATTAALSASAAGAAAALVTMNDSVVVATTNAYDAATAAAASGDQLSATTSALEASVTALSAAPASVSSITAAVESIAAPLTTTATGAEQLASAANNVDSVSSALSAIAAPAAAAVVGASNVSSAVTRMLAAFSEAATALVTGSGSLGVPLATIKETLASLEASAIAASGATSAVSSSLSDFASASTVANATLTANAAAAVALQSADAVRKVVPSVLDTAAASAPVLQPSPGTLGQVQPGDIQQFRDALLAKLTEVERVVGESVLAGARQARDDAQRAIENERITTAALIEGIQATTKPK